MKAILIAALAASLSAASADEFDLRFEDRAKIEDRVKIDGRKLDYDEPSGLSLTRSGTTFWTVSDGAKAVFNMRFSGKIQKGDSFRIDLEQLEGVADDGKGRLYAVQEKGNVVHLIDIGSRRVVASRALKDMEGFGAVRDVMSPDPNKGLEGVAVHPETGAVHVVLEGGPRLLIVLSPDLREILEHRELRREAGFKVSGVSDDDLDVSGLSFDAEGRLWIVSDKGEAAFRYDIEADRATGAPLSMDEDGDGKRVKNAEGIAFDAREGRLYVVNDHGKKSRLHVFEVEDR